VACRPVTGGVAVAAVAVGEHCDRLERSGLRAHMLHIVVLRLGRRRGGGSIHSFYTDVQADPVAAAVVDN